MERNDQQNNGNNQIWKILLGVFLAGAVIGVAAWGIQSYRQKEAQKQLELLAQQTNVNEVQTTEAPKTPEPAPTPAGEDDPYAELKEMGIPIPEKEVDFEALVEDTNPDIYAWIYIPDTVIDYPVLQHPTDNSYYLKYNIDGSKGYPGCIYTESYNEKDFSDPNTVLYGHNMKNGTMFAGLHRYEDEDFFEEHPYVYIYTPEKLLVYEIFAAYEHSDEHLLLNHDFTDTFIFQNYLDDVINTRSMNCNIREGVEVTADNHILTLSTCIANKPNNRYLVQGVLLNEDKR